MLGGGTAWWGWPLLVVPLLDGCPLLLGLSPRLETSFLLIDYNDGAVVVPSPPVKVGLTPFCELWKCV